MNRPRARTQAPPAQAGHTLTASALFFALASALAVGIADPGTAGTAPAGCEAVHEALARLDAQPRVRLRLDVHVGHHPDGYRRFELVRHDGLDQRIVDGWPLRLLAAGEAPSDAFALAPEGGCVVDPAAPAGTVVVHYDAWAERGASRVALWIDAASGLPTEALRAGPELAWGRSLARPTRPPQPQLRPTGGRLAERIAFDYGDAVPRPRRPALPFGRTPG